MTDPVFDKDGNLTNVDELTREEVATAYQAKNKTLFGRLTESEAREAQVKADKAKLESDLAESRKNKDVPTDQQPVQSGLSPEELRLIARGMSDAEISEAKDIAKGKGITLTEALETPVFKSFQAGILEEKRKTDAKLGAAQGSGQYVAPEGIKPGMTPAEHKAAWNKALGKSTP